MGEANQNPRSPQFKGDLPPYDFQARIQVVKEPSKAFKAANPELKGPVTLAEEDLDVVVYLILSVVLPSKLTDQWPTAAYPAAELSRMSMLEAKAHGAAVFAANGMQAQAALLLGAPVVPLIAE